ncbi:MAG: glucose/sorbosone dehydrogenase [Deltaproteobacteria bacterium]|nr:glucose/sorbosone dehydrogenase [Deltaproteobacteria bacterium]
MSTLRPQIFFISLLALFSSATYSYGELRLDKIKLPPGFKIEVYAGNVPGARSMTLSPGGILFVGTRDGEVYAVARV